MSTKIDIGKYTNGDVLKHVYHHGSAQTRGKWKVLSLLFLLYIACTVSEPFIYQQIIDLIIQNNGDFQRLFFDKIVYFIGFWGAIVIGGIISFALFQYIIWKYLNLDSGKLALYLARKFLMLPIDTHGSLGTNEI